MTYEYPIKCLECGLHFTVWSWKEDWHDRFKAFCPECGSDDHFIGFPKRERTEQIFEMVPGGPPVELPEPLKADLS
jgi:DNA-directed RNA polymerase subunit RPC12/RpoP